LSNAAAPYQAFEVVLSGWGTYGRVRPSTLQPLAGNALTATAEYVAHGMLDRSNSEPTRPATPEEIRRGPHPYELGGLVAQIVSFLPIHFAHRQLGEDGELYPWLDLRARLYMHRLAIRSFTYVEQQTETLKQLFGPFDTALRAAIGFGVEDALSLMFDLLYKEDPDQVIELGAGADAACRCKLDEARIAAHLAQLQEGIENDDVAAGEALGRHRLPDRQRSDASGVAVISIGAREGCAHRVCTGVHRRRRR